MFTISEKPDEQLIGLLFLFDYYSDSTANEVKIGYLFAKSSWGKGLASELIAGMINHLRGLKNVSKAIAGVVTENQASAKVLLKNGFSPVREEGGTNIYHFVF